ncbi:MAG: DUF4012 domain-containing protein [Patescibacteria group bacterium]
MKKADKKPQLRACSVCKKPGHNKSRCPEFLASEVKMDNEKIPGVQMFLHDEQIQYRSPHLVDLKKPSDPWSTIEAVAPEISAPSLYDAFMKEEPEAKPEIKFIAPKIITMPILPDDLRTKAKTNNSSRLSAFSSAFSTWRDNHAAKKSLAKMERELQTKLASEKKPEQIIEKEKIQPETTAVPTHYSHINRGRLALNLAWRAAVVALILITPFKANSFYQTVKSTTGQIALDGTQGFMALQDSTSALLQSNLTGAQDSVVIALQKFDSAVKAMNDNYSILQKIAASVPILSGEVQSRQNIITAGQKIALGNTYLIKGIGESQNNSELNLTDRVKILTNHLNAAIPNYESALADMAAVDAGVLPTEYQKTFIDFRVLFTAFLDDLNNLADLGKAVDEIFGGQGLRRYLIVFQNPAEIRPTGGFIGSFAVLDMKDGQIDNIDIPAGGSYDLQGQLDLSVEPPTPLLLSNKRWEFQDANWFADFPSSAENLMRFYRHSRQVTADGVIAINATVLERLLAIMGPVTDAARSVELTSSTALSSIQTVVEEGAEKSANKPKQIISDLAPQFINYIYNAKPESVLPLMNSLADALEQKEIQAYFSDTSAEQIMRDFGWSGQILPTEDNQDYLMVVNANIQGQKSDAEIKQTISHQAIVAEDGSVIDTVVITREHTGNAGDKFYGQTNIDYVRLYVPEGSELISAGGFTWPDEKKFRAPESWTSKDIFLASVEKELGYDAKSGTRLTNEFGKTALGNWLIVQPGETRQIQFTYKLPFKVISDETKADENILQKIVKNDTATSRYQLVVQRQSGSNSEFESQIIYPSPWYPSWNEGVDSTLAQNGMGINKFALINDQVWSLLMKNEKN